MPDRSACLFESVVGGEKVGRYSFLTAEPFQEIEARGNHVTFRRGGKTEEFESPDPIEELRNRVDALRAVRLPELPPFVSGAIGYAGYDVVRYTERLAQRTARRSQSARSFVRLLRSHGGVRQRDQNHRGSGDGPSRSRRTCGPLTTMRAGESISWSRNWRRRPPTCCRSISTPAAIRKSPTSRTSRRPISSGRWKNASSTFAPAIFFRSSSASGWN